MTGDTQGNDIVVVGASAGGVEMLQRFIAGVPADFGGSIFVVLHVSSQATSVLPGILARMTRMPVAHALDGEAIEPGRVYVAPPDYHLLVRRGHVTLDRGPSENGHRPAIDPLFRSAAESYGDRVVGVVLSGTLDDGTVGMRTITQHGGKGIAQDPDEALYRTMPESAIEYGGAGEVMPVDAIGPRLEELAMDGRSPRAQGGEEEDVTPDAPLDPPSTSAHDEAADAALTCPDCGGVLSEIEEGGVIRFRCQIGHQYSEQSLIALHPEHVEYALWMAVRALRERADLSLRVAARLHGRGHERSAHRFERDAEKSLDAMKTLRGTIGALEPPPLAEEAARG